MPNNQRKLLNNPPIQEAIFVITFKEPIPASSLESFKETEFVQKKFPIAHKGVVIDIEIGAFPVSDKAAVQKHKNEGYLLKSPEIPNRLIQVQTTHLSYHNLTKYDGWESMISELKELWQVFCGSVGKNMLSQLGVRYINNIKLPLPFVPGHGLQDYTKFLPGIPKTVTTSIDNFFIQIKFGEKGLRAEITETVLGVKDDKLSLILDLNVFKKGDFLCNESDMWDSFNELREYKNKVFFNCITEKTENLFL